MKAILRPIRRPLLWILGIAGIFLILYWGSDDQEIWLNTHAVGLQVASVTECRHNLRLIFLAATKHVSELQVDAAAAVEVCKQSECWSILRKEENELANIECHMKSLENTKWGWPKNIPRPTRSPDSYVINPKIFSRPEHLWKDSDVIAVDGWPRHIVTVGRPEFKFAALILAGGTQKRAYFNFETQQEPSLLTQIQNFADGIEGFDSDESWSQYYQEPEIDFGPVRKSAVIHLVIVFAIAVLWIVVFWLEEATSVKNG